MLSKIILFASVFYLVAGSIIKDRTGDHLAIEIPKECPDKGGCTIKPKGYDELVAKFEKLLPEYLKQNYTDRDGDEPGPPVKFNENDPNNCPYEVSTKIYYSYDGRDVLPQTSTFQQYVEVVECIQSSNRLAGEHVGEQCFRDVILRAFNQESSCKTVYKKYTLYKLSDDGTAIVPQVYDIPACCSCVVTNP